MNTVKEKQDKEEEPFESSRCVILHDDKTLSRYWRLDTGYLMILWKEIVKHYETILYLLNFCEVPQ